MGIGRRKAPPDRREERRKAPILARFPRAPSPQSGLTVDSFKFFSATSAIADFFQWTINVRVYNVIVSA